MSSKYQNLIFQHRRTLAVILFALATLMLTVRTMTLLNIPDEPNPAFWGLRDFRDAIYFPTISWMSGNNPYDASVHMDQYPVGQLFPLYSPLIFVIHVPFALLPYVVSEWVYFGFNVLMTLGLASLAMHLVGLRQKAWLIIGFAGLILVSRPGHMCQVLGQTAFTATLFSWLAIYFASKKKDLRAGLFVALASFKPTFGIILLPLLAAKGHFRAAIIGGLTTVILTGAIGLTLINRIGEGKTIGSVVEENRVTFLAHEGVNVFSTFSRDDLFPLLSRVFQVELSTSTELVIATLMILVSSLVIWLRSRSQENFACDGITTTLVCVTLIVSIYHHTYDTVILLLPWLAILVGRHSDWQVIHPRVRWLLLTLLTVPFVNYLSTNMFTSRLASDGTLRMIVTSVNGISLLVAWVVLATLSLSLSSQRKEAQGISGVLEPSVLKVERA